jgi:monofunctional biosynthetic peptidoglycan transglycosylase
VTPENPATTDENGAEPEGTRKRITFRRLAWRVLFVVGFCLAVYLGWRMMTWPSVAALAEQNPDSTAFIDAWEARNQKQAAWTPRSYSQISPSLKKAVLVAEDINFFHHNGFETEELKKAVRETLEEGKKLRGASTLTQQLAKNLWLSPSRNPLRKVEEALLTRQLERELGKRRILELYLNVVEFGPGVFGAEAAARHYFGKSAADLSDSEAAAMAASLPHSKWYPGRDSNAYRAHVKRVTLRMAKADWLDGSI